MGPLTGRAFETLMEALIRQLHEGPDLSGILLHLHGAMVVEGFPSGDAEIVRRVRKEFGPQMPIVVTHDYHANIAPSIIEDSDVLITFKENPHVDTYDRGYQAAEIMARMIRGEVRPVQVAVKPPMVYNIVYQSTFHAPFLPITEESRKVEAKEGVLAVSVSGGYQYADVPEMSPTAVVVTDNDPELARREAERLARMVWDSRHQTILDLPTPAEAVRMAMEHDGRPVLLIDMGDNIGGGSTGDSTFLLEELLSQNAQGWVMVVSDPVAYETAEKAGIGGEFDEEVGGKTDQMHGAPVRVRGHVRSLNVGRYYEPEVRHGGSSIWDMSHTAVIHVDGSTLQEPNLLLITREPSSPNSAHQLVSNGVYIERQKIIVVKGAIAPRAAYEPLVDRMIPVDSPGVTAVNPEHFHYRDVRQGVWGINDR